MKCQAARKSYAPCIPRSLERGYLSLHWPSFACFTCSRGNGPRKYAILSSRPNDRSGCEPAFFLRTFDRGGNADLVDRAHSGRAHADAHPFVLLRNEVLPILKVRRERAACLHIRMGDLIARNDLLSGDLADL